ncbi:MAG: hypothetical protein SOW51_09250 [Oscillospiraceae bacterium]|nr:hypothetical protein [Oscillospiraceae bacterium]
MSNNIPIKTRAVGGFDKKQVDQYLSSLDEEYEKSVSKEDIAKLREEIAELKKSIREKDKKLSELKDKLDDFDKSNENKPDFDNLSSSAKKFTNAHNEVVSIADKTSKYINSTERKLPSLLKNLSAVTKSISNLNDELSEIAKQLDSIEITPPLEVEAQANEPEEFNIFDQDFEG